jgi:hypothetical protein
VRGSGYTHSLVQGSGVEIAVVNEARRSSVLRGRSRGETVVSKREVVPGPVCGVL